MKKYNQLNLGQRYQIECLLGLGYNQTEIANMLGRNKSTISREISRNTAKRGVGAGEYRADLSQKKSELREKSKPKSKRLTDKMLSYIREQLKSEKWSPEIISQKGKEKYGDFVSPETIYQYIWKCKKSNKKKYSEDKELYKHLRHAKRYSKRSKTKQDRGKIPNRTPMSERPEIVERRTRIGDLEVDLMMGTKHRPGLIVITDRTTIETDLIKIKTKESESIADKIIEKLSAKTTQIKTLTFDNDLAFAKHELIAKVLNVKTYFTRPYTSQDKGTVENRIGVIRRFFPKGTDMTKVHWSTIKSVERKLNNRPVRKFNYLSPKEKKLLLTNVALVS
jgi:IS30 family transposase